MKFNYKKVATVLGSALMLGSTVAMAAAASFTPASFSDSGIALVVGANAANSDLKAAIDLTANLAPATSTTTSTDVTVTGGDAFQLKDVSDNLNLGNSLSTFGSSLNDEDMTNFLASGKYKDINRTEFDYDQTISVADANVTFFTDTSYQNKKPTLGISYARNAAVLNYTIDFGSVADVSQYVDTDLPLMGNMYYVLDASATVMTLLDSSASATLSEGETTTLTAGDESYEVSIDFVTSGSAVKLMVNGELTDTLSDGDSYELDDGAYIAIKDVLYTSKESGVSKVEFTIGKGKLELRNGNEIQLNDNNVQGVTSTYTSSSITIEWKTDDKVFLAGDSAEALLPGFETIKLVWNGISFPQAEKTVLDAGDTMYLNTQVIDGALELPLFEYNSTSGNFSATLGADGDQLMTNATASPTVNLTIGDMFVATYISGNKKEYATYAYELQSVTNDTSTGKTEVVLNNLAGGEDITFSDIGRDRTKGKVKLNLTAALDISGSDEYATIAILDADGSGNTITAAKVITASGMLITLPVATDDTFSDNNVTSWSMNFTESDKDGEAMDGNNLTATIAVDAADTNLHVSAVSVNSDGQEQETLTNDVYEGYLYSDLATMYTWDKSGDSNDFEVSYFGDEVKADVYVAASGATITGGSTGSTTTSGVMTVYDNEVSSVSTKNLIVIGGSAINSVASELLGGIAGGDAFTAATGIKAGEAIIKSFSRSGKVALLVAGYNAQDTTNAVTYLSNNAIDTTVGSALKVTSATSATAITA